MSEHRLDARGLLCPMPVIRTQERIAGLEPGDVLEVIASDPGAALDVPAWCRVHGHRVRACEADADGVRIVIEVGGTGPGPGSGHG